MSTYLRTHLLTYLLLTYLPTYLLAYDLLTTCLLISYFPTYVPTYYSTYYLAHLERLSISTYLLLYLLLVPTYYLYLPITCTYLLLGPPRAARHNAAAGKE